MNTSYLSRAPKSQAKTEQLGSGFELLVAENYEAMSGLAADEIAEELQAKPDLLLCAATGSTPTRVYQLLIAKAKGAPALFESLRIVKLDEWGAMPPTDHGSCEFYLQKHLILPLNIPPERYLSFAGQDDPQTECERITTELEKTGPVDLAILGLGVNGHLGFNEPADALCPMPHRAELAPSSLKHPMIRESKVSLNYGLTLGLAHLLQARTIILLVNGAHKAPAMKQLLSGQVSTHFPASFLWLHPRVFCFCDRAAIDGETVEA